MMRRTVRNGGYGLLRSVTCAGDGVFYQGLCPPKTVARPGFCACESCACVTPLPPCPRRAGVCDTADCLTDVTASAEDCNCNCGCGCDCDEVLGPGPVVSTCDCESYYAVLSAPAPAELSAEGHADLALVRGGGSGFRARDGGVEILRDGTYFVAYAVNAPENSQVCAAMGLTLDGHRLRESESGALFNGADHAVGLSGQTVLRARRGARLHLVSHGAATFPDGEVEAPLFTLTIVRVSP